MPINKKCSESIHKPTDPNNKLLIESETNAVSPGLEAAFGHVTCESFKPVFPSPGGCRNLMVKQIYLFKQKAVASTKEEALLLLDPEKTKQNKAFLFLFCIYRDFKDTLQRLTLYYTAVQHSRWCQVLKNNAVKHLRVCCSQTWKL